MSSSFDEATRFLFSRTAGKLKWSLGPTRALLDALGNPERHFSTIHIGGTNGKGSVATMVYAALRNSGLRVALYTSPHLVDVRERMVVDDVPISANAFGTWTERLRDRIVSYDASFFEATTAIAFADFAARGADLAVVEVGLGGRLDATNVVSPLVCAVTGVSLEHTEYLGNSLESIAAEKAGIAKVGVPFVVGETDPEVAQLILDRAEKLGAEAYLVPPHVRYGGPLAMTGRHQRRNAAVAEAILTHLPRSVRPGRAAIASGFGSAWLPGRYDRRGRWLFEVAHNPAGVSELVAQIRDSNLPKPLHALVGVLEDKDWRTILSLLRPNVDSMWLTVPPSAPGNRRLDVHQLATHGEIDTNLEADFDRAMDAVQVGAGTVLVVGSFHTVGDVMSRLPGFPPLG